jgi:hypothetical protein
MRFLYTVWFRDPTKPADDQDYEWPACFMVDAPAARQAAAWGDRLASSYATRTGQQFLSSTVETLERADLPGTDELPVIVFGHEATDKEIGW